MTIERRTHVYQGPGGPFEGVLAFPAGRERRPGVLVAHTWMGQTEAEAATAARLAEAGHVALAVDLYGQGKRPADGDEAGAMMGALNADRALLQARMAAALDALRQRPDVDPARIGAIGYCFGGRAVLDLARAGEAVVGVVSFHGVLDPPPFANADHIPAKVLVLHGWEDPLATPEQFVALARELTTSGVDWQMHAYGHTAHAFTAPHANSPERGLVYNPVAARRAWRAMEDFLGEVFA